MPNTILFILFISPCVFETHILMNVAFVLKDFSMDCGICYAYQLDGVIPDQVCDNAQCGQSFHQVCLYEVKIKISARVTQRRK